MATINVQDSSDSPEHVPLRPPELPASEPEETSAIPTTPEPTEAETTPTPTAPEVSEAAEEVPVQARPEELAVRPAPADEVADNTSDKAVDDIMKTDGDEALKAQDEAAETAVVMKATPLEKIKTWFAGWWSNPKKRYPILAVIVILAALFIVPLTRYTLLGLVFKSSVTVQAVDSKTGAPVSGAAVELAGQKAQTEASGKAVLHVHLGSKSLAVSKKYYGGYNHKQLVTFSGSHNHFKATLVAMGRQVEIKVVDKVSGKPLASATVNVETAKTKTKTDGTVAVIIPSGAATQNATVSASGYNSLPAMITADGNLAKNTFAVTPTGKLYFLSNLSGKLDVVKTNLDGSARQTVLAGTGSEDPRNTSLLASRDWKYLALLSKRGGNYASVYLIDTTSGDKLTTVDQGNADFALVGWAGDTFVYQATRNDVGVWQSNRQVLKSVNADTGQTLLLDQTQASGTSQSDYLKQSFGSAYIMGGQLVYAKNWDASFNNYGQLNNKQAELDAISATGPGHKVIKTFSVDSGTQTSYVGIATQLYEPSGLYIEFSSGSQDSFYKYENGNVTADSSITSATFYQTPYPTFLLSPSGNSTFWAEQRDGKNTLLTGDSDAQSSRQIATLSEYAPYGWYTDSYLLVSKNSSELYIMPAVGGTPLKITDYYKPALTYNGYGGGYGGL